MLESDGDVPSFCWVVDPDNQRASHASGRLGPTGVLVVVVNGEAIHATSVGDGFNVSEMVSPSDDNHQK